MRSQYILCKALILVLGMNFASVKNISPNPIERNSEFIMYVLIQNNIISNFIGFNIERLMFVCVMIYFTSIYYRLQIWNVISRF